MIDHFRKHFLGRVNDWAGLDHNVIGAQVRGGVVEVGTVWAMQIVVVVV